MSDKPQNEYLRAKILTASPAQLQTMLYDGAIRFCEQARQAVQAADIPATHDRLLRAQRIVLELSTTLKADLDPKLCGRLVSLYNYVYRLLVEANLSKDLAKLEEALQLLRYQRETWLMALENLRGGTSDPPTAPAARPPGTHPAPPAKQPARPGSLPACPAGGVLSVEG